MISEVLLVVCLYRITDAVSTVMLFPDNQTMCPWSNPYIVFQNYGYQDKNIPRYLNDYWPSLMHEESVLHLVDHLKQFKLVGHGGNAKVYEGMLKSTGQAVVIKTLTEGIFEELLHEAKIMAYLQESRYVPRLFGLIPAGPSFDEISMVVEYVENSSSVEDLLLLGDRLSECSWLSIIQQTTLALLELHSKFVLFNDLHMNNLIVSWQGSEPHVHIIDFGHASFRKGKSYSSAHVSIRDEFDFLPPEVWYAISTPASDIFSLGKTLEGIVKYINSSELFTIARKCISVDPKDRPLLQNIKDFIGDLYQAKCIYVENDITTSPVDNSSPPNFTTGNALDTVSIPLLSLYSLKMIKVKDQEIWLRYSNQTHIVLAKYKPRNTTVVVKMLVNVSFDDIRHEAAVNVVMNDTGYVPIFWGVVETGTSLESMSLVQEYFADGQTLIDTLDILPALDFSIKIVLALELAEALTQFHQKGLIINNLKTDNILIEFVDNYPVIKLIDIGKCSFHRGYRLGLSGEYLENIEYLAPELKQNMMSSHASDVYSMGVVLSYIFGAYQEHTEMYEIVSLCLEDDPARRPSATELRVFIMKIMSRLINNDDL